MSTMINFFQQGGPFMYPILIVFALGLAIAIERLCVYVAIASTYTLTENGIGLLVFEI